MGTLLESAYLMNNSSLNMSSYQQQQPNLALSNSIQLPALTAFIPSLSQNSPFRVSVHSWEKPRPTRMMESLMQPDDAVLYEVRVFIDGVCVSWVFLLSLIFFFFLAASLSRGAKRDC